MLSLLRSDDAAVRKALALRLVEAMPKKRLIAILDTYMSGDQAYYNVIHWLDLGASLSRTKAIAATKCAINSM